MFAAVWLALGYPGARLPLAARREPALTAASQSAPAGFRLVSYSTGAALYRRDLDLVQVVHLDQGAAVHLLHGPIVDRRSGRGVYGRDDPAIWRQPLQRAWREFAAAHPAAFCITNGQFFSSTKQNPTTLAFPLKKDGVIISDGYAIDKYPDQKLLLEMWPDRADIISLTAQTWLASLAPDVVAGLAQDVGARKNEPTGRTFAGVADGDRDGRYETVLIFNSPWATAVHAGDVLREFGADKVLMLDGGDSTQLICRGAPFVVSKSGREVPQMLAVTGGLTVGPAPPPACPVSHLVQFDDTLASIAVRYAASPWAIAYANGLPGPGLVFVGQTLCIP